MLTREDLIQANYQGEYVFFWKPKETNGCLGQWHMAPFTVEGTTYQCAEQYMMAEKARLMGDLASREAIMKTTSPRSMKALGRKIQHFDPVLWDQHKRQIVVRGNIAKFSQHPQLKAFLLATGDKVLVEASAFDTIWGIGLTKETRESHDPKTWRGTNLLGFALMEVRDQLRNA